MASNKNLGAIKKDPSMRKSVRRQKEELRVCGVAIPEYALNSEMQTSEDRNLKYKNYTMPKLNSVLKMKEEIENIESLELRPLKNAEDLSPRSKDAIIPKVSNRLNFGSSRPVFTNLVPINVNDTLLPKKTTSISNKYALKSTTKIPAPDLSDFLDPLPPQTHVVPLPEIELEFPEYEYDFLAAYERYIKEEFS